MDNKHGYLTEEDASKGILNKSLVHPREAFALAIVDRVASILCIPKQPSWELEPKKDDLRITEHLVELGKLVRIPVPDRVILGHVSYISFVDKGIL